MMPGTAASPTTFPRILRVWWPLAGSWLLMGLELPLVSAIMARLAHPEISLAAYGGVVFPISMIVEAPIIMLLSASTALSRDWPSFCLMRRLMMLAGAALTTLHILIAFTPLYGIVVGGLIHPPAEVLQPARWGLMIMTPWTWSIAYRRFQQGVLIRFGRSNLVGIGTMVRLGVNAAVLTAGFLAHRWPGIVVGSTAVACGVVAEAAFIGVAVRPVLRRKLRPAPPVAPPLTVAAFGHFYIPLALTSMLNLAGAPVISAALSRMPRALDSLAVWPVVTGLTFTLRSLGLALHEVVVALLDEPGAARRLRSFSRVLGFSTSALLLIVAVTPLAGLYFGRLSALSSTLTSLAARGILAAVLLPALSAWLAWYQGVVVHSHATRWITESVAVYLVTTVAALGLGVAFGRQTGLYIGLGAVLAGTLGQVAWLAWRSRPVVARLDFD
jgi:hypothetical protein